MSSIFTRVSPVRALDSALKFVKKLTRTTGKGYNVHQSNRAKKGLYHGADIMFGHSISHSHVRSKRRWYPNVLNKRVWSEALDNWIRFKMTAKALRAIDDVGGIDNYLLQLDERSVQKSNYVTKMRGLVGAALYHKGQLNHYQLKKLNYIKSPPSLAINEKSEIDESEQSHLI
mmetsp:Transcript_26305/g.26559  ORF Transcript_26305/g.26559 Transcript_26305/m.26559 type:complete len:173 (+) Transcript_26305:133-651(+)